MRGRLRSTGVSRPLPASARFSGQWTSATPTRRVWRAMFTSADAKVVRVHLINFHVGQGTVYVTNPDSLVQTFRFIKDGPHGDGEFWSPMIHSNSAMVEWDPGEGAETTLRPPFEVAEVMHILTTAAAPATVAAAVAPGDYACYVDYLCGTPNWGSAEAQLNFIDNGQSFVCSGTLINPKAAGTIGTAPKPLLLTANHCISSNTVARTLVAVQGDWYTACGGTTRAPTYQVLGQALLANTAIEQGDHSLILLGAFPPSSTWQLSGWNTGDLAMGSAAIGLSHPDGLPLKLSLGTRIADVNVTVTENDVPIGLASAGDYYHMNWTSGLIGGGSSGSGVFDSSDHLFGTLTWGNGLVNGSQCGNEGGYGKLSTGYASLQPWLETSIGGETISQMISPAPRVSLTSSSGTFSWGASAGASEYQLWIGSAPGSANYFTRNTGTAASIVATGLPVDGGILYARLWTHLAIGWYYFDYTYTAFSAPTLVPLSVTSSYPLSVPALSPALDVTVYGAGFALGAQVKAANGIASLVLNATFVNSTTLTTTLPTSILATKGTITLTVVNPGGVTSSTSATLTVSAPTTTTYTDTTALPHFAAGGPFVSGFYVFNNSNNSGQFQISFYDDSGRPISIPVTGFGSVSQFADSVSPNGTRYYEAGNGLAGIASGSAVFKSTSSAVAVQELFRNHAPDNNYFEASVGASRGSFEFLVPFDATVLGGTQSYTGFAIANLDAAATARITCTARDSSGSVVPNALTVPALNPLGHWADFNFPAIAGTRGTFDCTSNTKIAPIALRALGSSISSLPVTLK